MKRFVSFTGLALVLSALFIASLFSSSAHAQTEFRVNSTLDHAGSARMSMNASGMSVVVWTREDVNWNWLIYIQRFDANGQKAGNEIVTGFDGTRPQVAIDALGNFVVVWELWDYMSDSEIDHRILAQRFKADGSTIGTIFRVDTDTPLSDDMRVRPAVTMNADGSFMVVWEERTGPGKLNAQCFDKNGAPIGSLIEIDDPNESEWFAQIACASDGSYTVTWEIGFASATKIRACRFSSGGTPLTTTFDVKDTPGVLALAPDVATDNNGNGLFTWIEAVPDQWPVVATALKARRMSTQGLPLGDEFQVNAPLSGKNTLPVSTSYNAYERPAIAANANGDFLIVWEGQSDGDSSGIFGQRYDSNGQALGTNFLINKTVARRQFNPSTALSASGKIFTAWTDGPADYYDPVTGQENYDYNIRGIFRPFDYAPTTTSQRIYTMVNKPVTFSLQATHPYGDALTYTISTPPVVGKLERLAANQFRYTPPLDRDGSFAFSFTASNGRMTSPSTPMQISVQPYPLVALNQSVPTAQNKPVEITLTSTGGSAPITYNIVTPPRAGFLTRLSNNRYRFTPPLNRGGSIAFAFNAADAKTVSNTAYVTVRIPD